MAFTLPHLPYAKDALHPHISASTLDFHYDKHHRGYVDKLNTLTKDTAFSQQSLESVIIESRHSEEPAIFNNAAQVWNHTFYWDCMAPEGKGGGTQPSPFLLNAIQKDFGHLDAFKTKFKEAAISQFGSGWAWLIVENGELKIMKTANADTPLAHNKTAVLTCDVWEHAYYLDFQNRRPDYVDVFLNHLINWEFVEANLKQA